MHELKSYSFETHQGPHLNLNEDLIDIDLNLKLYLLLDGFGGSGIGDRAATQIKDNIKSFFGKIATDPDSTLPFYFSSKYLLETNALVNAFRSSHEQIAKENLARSIFNRGGASVMALGLAGNIATIVSTGNCKALIYRKGNLFAQVLPDAFANAPMSGIGLFEDFHYQVSEFKIRKDDALLMLTDGAYERCEQEKILEIINKNLGNEKIIIQEIFNYANDRGNLDNQSIMFLQF